MSALAPTALAGVEVGYSDPAARVLAGGLAELGARIADTDAPVDLLLVPLDAAGPSDGAADRSPDGTEPSASGAERSPDAATLSTGAADPSVDAPTPSAGGARGSLDAVGPALAGAAGGALADSLTAAFSEARDGAARLRPGGCLLFVLSPAPGPFADDPARAAVASLARTLALEWAPDLRVNAIVCASPADAIDLAALMSWPASRTLTGAVLEAEAAGAT